MLQHQHSYLHFQSTLVQVLQSPALSPATSTLPGYTAALNCTPSSYTCGAQQAIELTSAMYQAIQKSSICTPIGGSMCGIDGLQIESRAWAAVKAGTCGANCQG